MKSDIRGAALAALSASSHLHKGVRPAGASDQEAPCSLLATDDSQGFDEAVIAAEMQWPLHSDWDIVASDYLLADQAESEWRDGIGALGMPLTLGRFSTLEDSDGPAEDPGGLGDF
jgi:hypothetical protein